MTGVTNAVALRNAFSFRLFPTSNIPFRFAFNVLPTDYLHHTMTPRRGPLRDLPLELFTDVPSTSIPTTPPRIHKRPLSPGTPNLFSPTKRRILAQEGVFSPEKTVKSSIFLSDRASVIYDVLTESPARKLDFGRSPRNDSKVASTSRLFEDCFTEPTPRQSRSSCRHDRDHSSLPIPNASPSQLTSIPPSSPNPQTDIHYPGFDVWVDRDLSPSSLSNYSSLEDSHAFDDDKENSHDDKENAHPKAKWRTGLPKRLKRDSFAPPEKLRGPNTLKIPFTPLNARSPLKARPPRELTPGKTLKVSNDEMKRRRELLALELDGDEDSDDDRRR